jgi:hypothetical protein
METSNPVMLECSECGHTWKPRNTLGKSRECSKCGSENIEEFDPDETMDEVVQPGKENEIEHRTASRPHPTHIDEFLDDPEVKAKRKELELVRLQKQIDEVKSLGADDKVIKDIVYFQKVIISSLHESGLLGEEEFQWLIGACYWCEGSGMVSEGTGWKCSVCGRVV